MSWAIAATARRQFGDQQDDEVRSDQVVPVAQAVERANAVSASFQEIIQYTFFHRSATASPTQDAGQSPIGVVTGRLNAGSANGYVTYSLAQAPAQGTVEISDYGTYTYTPNDTLAVVGGSDGFRVTIDNGSTYRLTGIEGAIQGILIAVAQLIGLRQPDAITVTVPVAIAHPDADGTLSQADLDRLAQVGAIGADQNNDGLFSAIVGTFTGSPVTDAQDAMEAMNRVSGLLAGSSRTFTGEMEVQSAGGTAGAARETFYRLHQTVNGIPVLGSEVILTALDDGTATGVFSGIDPQIYRISTSPSSSIDQASEAVAAAGRILLGSIANPPSGLLNSLTFDQRLVIYGLDPAVPPALTWMVDISTNPAAVGAGIPFVSTTYFIRANGADAGSLLAEASGIESASSAAGVGVVETQQLGLPHGLTEMRYDINVERDGSTYRMRYVLPDGNVIAIYNGSVSESIPCDPALGCASGRHGQPGNVITKQGASWEQSAVSAMANMTTVYSFFKSQLGWTPKTDTAFTPGRQIRVVVLDEIPGTAVYFGLGGSPYSITFGEDYEAALDVVGHEYTHGFIRSSTRSGFSGSFGDALDEAYGDIIGNLIEDKRDDGRWLVGEDGKGAPLRDMKDPSNPSSGQLFEYMTKKPADMSGFVNEKNKGHYNSTIFSHAAYLMMNSDATRAVSNQTWARIFADSIRRLPSNPTFQQARNAVIGAAIMQGLSNTQQEAIAKAFNDVGISSTPQVKIVLTWGDSPSDLDSHLTGPTASGGSRFHVYYSQREYFGTYSNQSCSPTGNAQTACRLSVDLDYDDTTSYGPESTTIRNLVPGDYYFYVHNFSNRSSTNSTALATSRATVTLYKPDSTSAWGYAANVGNEFRADNSTPGTLWTVFKLTIPAGNAPGNIGQPVVTVINTYSYQSSPSSVGQ